MYKRIYSIFIMMFLSFQVFSTENAQQNAQDSDQNDSVTSENSKNAAGLMAGAGAIGAGAMGLGYALGRKSFGNQIKKAQKEKSEAREKLAKEVDMAVKQAKMEHPPKLHPILDEYGSNVKKIIRTENKKEFEKSIREVGSSGGNQIVNHPEIDRNFHDRMNKIAERSIEI